ELADSSVCFFFFFFSSRRRHTRWPRDWSSDVCSSDLGIEFRRFLGRQARAQRLDRADQGATGLSEGDAGNEAAVTQAGLELKRRSEERRVGKECRARRGRA